LEAELCKDYIATPKSDGYRAVHLVVRYHGRLIEWQLRTRNQQEWASFVERVSAATTHDIKNGQGPEEIFEWLRLVAQFLATLDEAKEPDDALIGAIAVARVKALPFLDRGSGDSR
jgi:ppGpp synthetase/RelA/SpoT-type nucleotidyltranferase